VETLVIIGIKAVSRRSAMNRIPLFFVVVGLLGCDEEPPPAALSSSPSPHEIVPISLPAGHPRTDRAAVSGAHGQPAHSGIASEVLLGGGYSYVRIDEGTRQVWVAGPQTAVVVGDRVQTSAGTEMRNFESKTLKRTFPSVLFVSSIRTVEDEATVAIERLPGGHTIQELVTQRAALSGKSVRVRGRVAKVTNGVMGKNFLHLQDGTGTPANQDDDLTVTTQALVAVGDVIDVRGTLITDKDLGAGYRYDVLLQDAKIVRVVGR
jgi:hypothetical protein